MHSSPLLCTYVAPFSGALCTFHDCLLDVKVETRIEQSSYQR